MAYSKWYVKAFNHHRLKADMNGPRLRSFFGLLSEVTTLPFCLDAVAHNKS